MKPAVYISKIVIFFMVLTAGKLAFAQFLSEVEIQKKPTDWAYQLIFKRPKVSLKNENGELIISGTDAFQKKQIALQLENWTGLRAQNFNEINWANNVRLTPLLTDKFKQFRLGSIYPSNGVNCHGSSLYMSGLLKRISHVDNDELKFYLENYCEEVREPEAGAIGVLQMADHIPVYEHSFIVVGKNLTFEKQSIDRTDPFRFNLINNFGKTRFFKCHRPENTCLHKYQKLQADLDNLDRVYSIIFKTGDDQNLRENARHLISPLMGRIENALKYEREEVCQMELLRAKYRLVSLKSVADKILGWGLYKEGVGRLIHRESPL